jgi:hypothetical protein
MEIPLPQSYRDGDVWLFSWGEALAGFARIFQLPEHPLLGITSLDSSSFLSLHQNSKGSTELGLFQQGHYHGVKAQCPSLMLWNRLAYDEAEGRVVLWQNGSTQLSVWSEADESVMKTLDAGAKLRDVKVLRTQQESCLLIATDHDLRWLTFDGALVSSYRRPGFNPKGLTLTDRGVAVLDVRHDHGWVYDFELKTQKITAGWVALKPIKIPLHDQWNWTCDPSAKRIWTLDAIEQSLTRWQWTEDPSWTMRDQDCFHNPNQVPQVIFNHDGLTVMRPRGVERIEF